MSRRANSTATAATQAPSVIKENPRYISDTRENLVKAFPDLDPQLAARDIRSGLSSRRSSRSDMLSRRSSAYSVRSRSVKNLFRVERVGF